MMIIVSGFMLNYLVIGAMTRPIEDNYPARRHPVAGTVLEGMDNITFERDRGKLEVLEEEDEEEQQVQNLLCHFLWIGVVSKVTSRIWAAGGHLKGCYGH
jgi:hypothetical protein